MEKTGLKLTRLDDLALARMAADGRQDAYLVLYDRYKHGVFLHVSQYVPQREDAEDVVLESFQKAFSQIASYNPEYKFTTWLYKIARNTALDHLEKITRNGVNIPTNSIDDKASGLEQVMASSGDPEEAVILTQEYDKLVDAINGLSVTYREVATMVLLENYGYQEVADKLNLPLGTVKIRVKRAKENIVKKVNSQED